ncbi:inhibitor of Bruton tyrosine kinase [Nephila pilipes]|uniref:Inhibitor of Bruton tyrosine kinase n=1 Tax=Nephila pilipes TaxID=299642 RepID=A0A8X6INT6_NEPPI|nr:inhibitor of Bruton tyrosine kinase [Nephila pilipes]
MHQQDDFHDIIIKVGKREFAAHKYILSSRCDYFKNLFSKESCQNDTITIDKLRPEAFEQVLKYIYTNQCDFLVNGNEIKWEEIKQDWGKTKLAKRKYFNPIHIFQETCKILSLDDLSKRLDGIQLINGRIFVGESCNMKRMTFNRKSMSNLYDVNLISSNETVFGCHKCILAARLDYFHSMLSTCWVENSQLGNLSLPISTEIMEVLIEYIYTDDANKLLDSENIEFLCHVLMISDQLLISRLKEICESALVRLLSLKNAAELLELSSVYNSVQLKRSCMQFICINLPAVIESKILDVLNEEVMEELSTYYRNLIPWMYNRRISINRNAFEKDLELLEKQFPISDTSVFEKNEIDTHEGKRNRLRCTNLHSYSKEVPSVDTKVENEVKSPDKNILLDILTSEINEKNAVNKSFQEKPMPDSVTSDKLEANIHILKCPNIVRLDQIMMEEKLNFTPLQKKTSFPNKKPMPRLSQKQKKMMKANQAQSPAIPIPDSPHSQSACPWAKSPEQSLPSPSFWETLAKKEFQPSPVNKDFSTPVKGLLAADDIEKKSIPDENISSCASSPQDIVISFHAIQLAEEQKQHRAVNPKIKPLHILNIEDQAIEELLTLYNAQDNHKEKITISRVQPDEIACPIWKRRGH